MTERALVIWESLSSKTGFPENCTPVIAVTNQRHPINNLPPTPSWFATVAFTAISVKDECLSDLLSRFYERGHD